MKRFYISLLTALLVFTGCFEDFDDSINPASDLEIQNFIYRGLNYFYLNKANGKRTRSTGRASAGYLLMHRWDFGFGGTGPVVVVVVVQRLVRSSRG